MDWLGSSARTRIPPTQRRRWLPSNPIRHSLTIVNESRRRMPRLMSANRRLPTDPVSIDVRPSVVRANGSESSAYPSKKLRLPALGDRHRVYRLLEHAARYRYLFWVEPSRHDRARLIIQRRRICRTLDHPREALLVVRR